jgi:cardiolipin synthase
MTLSYLPNAITLARIALVPVLILALKDQRYGLALALFVLAGLSDALDGFLAKRLNMVTRLGGVLDPAADKILLISAYVMLTVLEQIPFWLMLTVAFRDLLIVGGYLIYVAHSGPVHMRPSALSKLNTFMQITLVGMILVEKAGYLSYPGWVEAMIYGVFATTVASGLHYLWAWGVIKDIELAGAAKGKGAARRRGAKRTGRQD